MTTPALGGAWTKFADITPRVSHGTAEDPFMWIDAKGHWHIINHVYDVGEYEHCGNSTVSAHLFSFDGFEWHTTATQPFGTEVALSDGGTMTLSTRERPKLLFAGNGTATHLFSGASALPNCWNETQCHWTKRGDCANNACTNCKFRPNAGCFSLVQRIKLA